MSEQWTSSSFERDLVKRVPQAQHLYALTEALYTSAQPNEVKAAIDSFMSLPVAPEFETLITNEPGEASKSSAPPRLRTSRACDRCRKRKQGCVAERPCPRCVNAGCGDSCCDTEGKNTEDGEGWEETPSSYYSVVDRDSPLILPPIRSFSPSPVCKLPRIDPVSLNAELSASSFTASSAHTSNGRNSPSLQSGAAAGHTAESESSAELIDVHLRKCTVQSIFLNVAAVKDQIAMGLQPIPKGFFSMLVNIVDQSGLLSEEEQLYIREAFHTTINQPLRDYSFLIDRHFALAETTGAEAPIGVMASTLDARMNSRVYTNDLAAQMMGVPMSVISQRLYQDDNFWAELLRGKDLLELFMGFFQAASRRQPTFRCRITWKLTGVECVHSAKVAYADDGTPILIVSYLTPID